MEALNPVMIGVGAYVGLHFSSQSRGLAEWAGPTVARFGLGESQTSFAFKALGAWMLLGSLLIAGFGK